jgi:lysophospholipase L1-like esterase
MLFFVALLLPISKAWGQHVSYSPFMHYTDRVNEFEKMRAVDSTDVVMLGNSLTEFGGDWSKLLRAYHVRNRGIAGDDANGIYQRLSQILPGKPKAIFLMVGINDIANGLSIDEVASRCERVIAKIRHDSPRTKLYVQSLLPINESFGRWTKLNGKTEWVPQLNARLRAYCKKKGIGYINLFPFFVRHGSHEMRKELTADGLHLTPQGYKEWGFVLKKYIVALS